MAIETATTATVTQANPKFRKQFQAMFDVITARLVIEEDSIASGASSAAVYTVPGVKQGDFAFASLIDDAGDGMLVNANVTDDNEVTVILTDATAATNTTLATAVNVNLLVLQAKDSLFTGGA